ncbi:MULTISPECIES: pyridoxal phosphate-dependent aminotransferase [Rhodomicrobium]|uniref:pyridoxal phosphate-dependent aminotransferase n=1 Tax=Rhodomicrobium TaxID=1068 RepID=UPI000B4B3AA3|nr:MULTISPECIES: pyridoxal phosphate-dependent aminotransferase [Rhodomicrobium]
MSDLISQLAASARTIPESGIVKLFNYGRNRDGLIALWAGEGETPTSEPIRAAASAALAEGQTFYTYQRGIPPLREAIAGYMSRLYDRPMQPEEFFSTIGGMGAIQICVQMLVGHGNEVVVPGPSWPNFAGAILSRGGVPRFVPMQFGKTGWTLDLDRLFDACTERTRALFINSPSNPTGWVASEEELRAILTFARDRGLWIIADEIYGRFYYDGDLAPSFQTLREPGDRILFVQTFSKMWAMTGWRMGWLQAPPELGQTIENLIQYNTSGVASFLQPAGTFALTEGDADARGQIARARTGRDIVCSAIEPFGNVSFAWPAGAFYLMFGIDGVTSSLDTAMRLVDEANIGLAPGSAFGPGGEGYFRICYQRSPAALREAMGRLTAWLEKND